LTNPTDSANHPPPRFMATYGSDECIGTQTIAEPSRFALAWMTGLDFATEDDIACAAATTEVGQAEDRRGLPRFQGR
jgi:hypothetical protein